MSDANATMDLYLTGLRNQHAVETQAIGTIKNQLGRMEAYPELHAQMTAERERSTEQASRLDRLLDAHGSKASIAKEAASGGIATVTGFAHSIASDEVLKNVLSAVGFKAYEAASYTMLIALAEAAEAANDVRVLEQSRHEEQAMGEWLNTHLPTLTLSYLRQEAA